MTLEFGTPIVGFDYLGEHYSINEMFDHLVAKQQAFIDYYFAESNTTMKLSMVEVIIDWVEFSGFDVDDLDQWPAEYPKPLHVEELSCRDFGWIEGAPSHFLVPMGAPKKDQTCAWCDISAGQTYSFTPQQ